MALLRLAERLERHLRLLMAHSKQKPAFLLAENYDGSLDGYNIGGESLWKLLELLTCRLIDKIKSTKKVL